MNSAQVFSRRDWMTSTAQLAAGLSLAGWVGSNPSLASAEGTSTGEDPYADIRYCFNTATLRGQKLPVTELIDLVAAAGYDSIEVWIDELDRHVADGGTLGDLAKRCRDHGLKVESAIAFANWLADDPAVAKAECEKARRDMEKVAAIGGSCIAAPPSGHNNQPIEDWDRAAERLAALAKVGKEAGVQPQLEVWGFSKCLGNLPEAIRLATMTDSKDFGILLDVYHLYKGGSSFQALRLVSGTSMKLFHINDYPAMPPRETIGDGDRVFPGDGVAPLDQILETLVTNGFRGALSLELFNQSYWERPSKWVVETGLAKMKAAVASAQSQV